MPINLWSSLPDSSFHDGPYMFNMRQIFWPVSHMHMCLWNHVVVAHAEWELALSWSNNHGLPMKDIILMAVCLCTTFTYSHLADAFIQSDLQLGNTNTNICLHVNGTLTHMPVTHAVCSAAPPYHDRHVLLHLSLMKSLDGPFGLWDWKLDIHFSQEISWNVDSFEHSTHFHCFFFFDYLRWALVLSVITA